MHVLVLCYLIIIVFSLARITLTFSCSHLIVTGLSQTTLNRTQIKPFYRCKHPSIPKMFDALFNEKIVSHCRYFSITSIVSCVNYNKNK